MTQEQILSRLLSGISDEFDKTVGSFFYDVDRPLSEQLAEIYVRVEEILKTIGENEESTAFAKAVFERFANPYIKHYLSSIALNSVSKFKVRVLPSITK